MRQVLRSLDKEESMYYLQKTFVATTLYEMIEAINEVVRPEESHLIPKIVVNLLNHYRSNCWVQ